MEMVLPNPHEGHKIRLRLTKLLDRCGVNWLEFVYAMPSLLLDEVSDERFSELILSELSC